MPKMSIWLLLFFCVHLAEVEAGKKTEPSPKKGLPSVPSAADGQAVPDGELHRHVPQEQRRRGQGDGAAESSHQPGIQPTLTLVQNQTDEHFGASEAVLNWRNLRDKIHARAAHNAAGLQSHQTSNASAAATDRHFDHAVAQYHAGAASHQTNVTGHLATPNQLNAMQTAHHQKQPSSSSRHGESRDEPSSASIYHRTLSLDTAELISKERDHRILRRMQTFHAYLGRLSPTQLAIVKQNAIDEAQANHRRMVGVAPVAAAPVAAAPVAAATVAAIHHPAGQHLVQNDAAVQEPSAALAPSNHQHQQLINHQRTGEFPTAALAQINHERTMMGKSTAPASSSQPSTDHRIDLSNYQQPLSKKGEKSSSHPFGHHSAAFSSPSSSTAAVHETVNVPMQTLLNPLPTQTATRNQPPSLASHANLPSPPLRIGEADSTTLGGADHLTALQLATATSTGRELGQQPATGAAALSSTSPRLQRIHSFRNILDGMSPAKRSHFQTLATVAQRPAIGGGTSSASHHHLPSAAVSEPSSAIVAAVAPPPLLDLLSPRTAIGHGQPSSSIPAAPHHPTNIGPSLELRQPNAAAPHSATGVVELRLFSQHIPERSNVDAGNDYTSTGRESPSASEPVELLLFPLRNENAASGQPAAKRLRKD